MTRGFWPGAGTAIFLLATSSPAWAQTAPAAGAPAADEQDNQYGDIVVTARKREERLIDVPQSITAVSAADLARLNATQFRDFANTIPALSFTTSGAGQSQITLRGVTAGADIGQTVGIYVDDVPYGSSSAFTNAASLGLDVGLFDLDRLEVLRGPQGTLYGASAMGGVLKYVTRRPSLTEFGGNAQAGLSFTEHGGVNYDGAVAVDVPIVPDRLGLRASGFYARDGGFITNIVSGDDAIGRSRVYGGRLDFLFRPTDALSVRIIGFAQDIRRNGTTTADYTLAGQPVDGELDQRRLKTEPFDQRFRLVSGTISYDFGAATLTSISSYQTTDSDYRQDISALYVPVLGQFGFNFSAVTIDQGRSTDKFTQEVRLASSGNGMIEWLAGGFYTHERSGNRQHLVAFDPAGAVFPTNLLTVSLPSTYEEIAGFGNVTVHLSQAFDVTGGLRYARNDQSYAQNGSGLLIGSAPTVKASENVVTWLANARYRFSPHATAYLRFATGYRPGGPNFVVRDPVTGALLAPTSFQSDTLESFEAGFRGETADRSLGIDLAAYHIDWDDMQVVTAAGALQVIANANRAKIDGAELTLTARPSQGFTVTGAFAYQDARLAEDSPLLGGVRGDPLPNVPKFTAALSADYRGRNGVQPTVGATLRFVSDRVASFDASGLLPQYDLGQYVSVDLRAGATFGRVQAQLFVRNLFDDRGQLSASTFLSGAGGPTQVTILQPRTIGISATTRF
jgi:iron complex outermembrane receptor protein